MSKSCFDCAHAVMFHEHMQSAKITTFRCLESFDPKFNFSPDKAQLANNCRQYKPIDKPFRFSKDTGEATHQFNHLDQEIYDRFVSHPGMPEAVSALWACMVRSQDTRKAKQSDSIKAQQAKQTQLSTMAKQIKDWGEWS